MNRWRVIPSVLDLKSFDKAIESNADEVLLSNVHIGNLASLSLRAREAGKKVLVHCDLIGGFKADICGLRLLKNQYGVDGIFSSSHAVLSPAKRLGLRRYFRVFLMDSRSVNTTLEALSSASYDGVELLPGPVAIQYAKEFREVVGDREMLAGGFIRGIHETEALRQSGFDGVTSSSEILWNQ